MIEDQIKNEQELVELRSPIMLSLKQSWSLDDLMDTFLA